MSQHIRHVPAGRGDQLWVVGDTYTFKAKATDTDGQLAFFEASVPPGAGPPPHIHRAEDEFYYLLDGELEVLDNGQRFTASTGAFLFVPRGALHCFRNRTDRATRLLVGVTPAGFEEFFFAVGLSATPGGTAPPLGPEEMARTMELAPRFGLDIRPEG
jgi:quercetin dioxygenase-like cupin family protein